MIVNISYTKSSIGIMLTNIIIYPLSIVIGILIARNLGPYGKGVFSYMGLLSNFLLPLFLLGYQNGVLYYISSEKVIPDNQVLSILGISGITGCLYAIVLLVLWEHEWLGQTAKQIPLELFIVMILYQPIASMYLVLTKIINGMGWFTLNNFLSIFRYIVLLVSVSLSLVILDYGLKGAIYSYVLSTTLVFFFGLMKVLSKLSVHFKFDLKIQKEMFIYGIKSILGNIANRMNARMDQFILSIFTSSSQLGIYSIAVSISEMLWIIPSSIGPVLFKKIAVTQSKKEKVLITDRIHRIVMLVMSIMAVVFFILSIWLIPFLYGDKFKKSILVLAIYLPGATFFVSRRIIVRYFGASGMPLKQSIDQIVGAIVGITSFLILIPHFGVYGAALGSSLSYLASVLTIFILYRKDISPMKTQLFKLKGDDILWLRKTISSIFRPKNA